MNFANDHLNIDPEMEMEKMLMQLKNDLIRWIKNREGAIPKS